MPTCRPGGVFAQAQPGPGRASPPRRRRRDSGRRSRPLEADDRGPRTASPSLHHDDPRASLRPAYGPTHLDLDRLATGEPRSGVRQHGPAGSARKLWPGGGGTRLTITSSQTAVRSDPDGRRRHPAAKAEMVHTVTDIPPTRTLQSARRGGILGHRQPSGDSPSRLIRPNLERPLQCAARPATISCCSFQQRRPRYRNAPAEEEAAEPPRSPGLGDGEAGA